MAGNGKITLIIFATYVATVWKNGENGKDRKMLTNVRTGVYKKNIKIKNEKITRYICINIMVHSIILPYYSFIYHITQYLHLILLPYNIYLIPYIMIIIPYVLLNLRYIIT